MNLGTLWLNHDRDEYLAGRISVDEFERRVGVTMQIVYEQVTWQVAQKRAQRVSLAGPV